MDEAIAAVPQVLALDRRKVRRRFEERFTAERMAHDYVDLYRKQVALAGLDGPVNLMSGRDGARPIVDRGGQMRMGTNIAQ